MEWLRYLKSELSRVLRYSYPGFLTFFLASVINDPNYSKISALGWPLILLVSVAIGAGLYSIHRALIIPVHYLGLTFLLWIWDRLRKIKEEDSTSPTRWLRSLGVERCRLMLAYVSLRRTEGFLHESEQRKLAVAHAENGLIVMTAEGFFVVAALIGCHHEWDSHGIGWFPFLVVGIVLWVGSYFMAIEQHKLECMSWRQKQANDDSVRSALISAGILPILTNQAIPNAK